MQQQTTLQQQEKDNIDTFIAKAQEILIRNGIEARIELRMRKPYSVWR